MSKTDNAGAAQEHHAPRRDVNLIVMCYNVCSEALMQNGMCIHAAIHACSALSIYSHKNLIKSRHESTAGVVCACSRSCSDQARNANLNAEQLSSRQFDLL